ncbi:nucleotidyltransferase family protein [Prolixibacter sp. SD074]|uniref:nucleotidyltransferase family protein n=1 Tax=Prolixibacter sp. SD074 TaxID=2652391 RepID=UPI00126F2AD8|nr:nucleotidyltransferase family protein [Prolixibacter sp. SD074]GET29479.1 mannose-1-phosphate guanylyltransferase [Prolixibacter sp. SD074]
MKAMIFAAGLGTRLRPLTDNKPKALVEVAGKTLLQRAIEKVSDAGFDEIVVNIHHFGGQIIDFLKKNDNFGLDIRISDERGELLDTGGGILKARRLLEGLEPFLVYNVDVLCSLDLKKLLEWHRKHKALATLVVRKRETARYLLFDKEMQLSGWTNSKTGEIKMARQTPEVGKFAFSGIHIIEPSIFPLITETGKFPIIPMYLRLAAQNAVYGFEDTSGLWMDLGKPGQLKVAEEMLSD